MECLFKIDEMGYTIQFVNDFDEEILGLTIFYKSEVGIFYLTEHTRNVR